MHLLKKVRIAVIGAGLAGLVTNYLLQKKSHAFDSDIMLDVQLFEASDRVGGRIHTLRCFSDKLYAEAGAMLLTDNEPRMLSITKELGLDLLCLPANRQNCFHINGKWADGSAVTQLMQSLTEDIQDITKIIRNPNDWIDKPYPILEQLDNISIVQHLVEKNYTPENAQHLLSMTLLGLYADDLNNLSAFDALRFLSQYLFCKTMYAIHGGNDRLPLALNRKLQRPVYLNTPVTQVSLRGNCWEVFFADPDKSSQLFDYVVMAVPLSLLQTWRPNAIQLPNLPKNKREIIDNSLYNQSLSRVYCEVNQRFWEEQPATTFTDHATLWIEDHSTRQNHTHAILEIHACGARGRDIQQAKQPNQFAETELATIYGNKFKQSLLSQQTTHFFWKEQPFQQGVYPYFNIGQRHFIRQLKMPFNGLFFAGDYTDAAAPCSMNGAVQSAYRVVEKELWPTLCEKYQKYSTIGELLTI